MVKQSGENNYFIFVFQGICDAFNNTREAEEMKEVINELAANSLEQSGHHWVSIVYLRIQFSSVFRGRIIWKYLYV